MPAIATISSLCYELGRRCRIDELPEFTARPDLLALLAPAGSGLRYYHESDETPYALARRCAQRTIEDSGVAPASIDAVMFASDSLDDAAALGRLLADLELVKAYPINVSLSDCANLPIALRVASA